MNRENVTHWGKFSAGGQFLWRAVVYDQTVQGVDGSRRSGWASAIVVWACLVAGCAAAQTAPAGPKPVAQTPTVVTNAEEVALDLVVRDKRGNAVSDLRPGDLQIIDGGAAAKISGLRLVNATDERLVTLVFDRLDPAAGRAARGAASTILKMAPAGRIRVAVFDIEGALRLVEFFTSDRRALTKAIRIATVGAKDGEAQKAEAFKGLMQAGQSEVARVVVAALQDGQRIVQDQHARASLAGLLALARAERELPGRKAMVYFAQGMQVDSSAKEMVRSIVGAANRSAVSIYAVDANGLDEKTSNAMMASLALRGSGFSGGNSPTRGMAVNDITPAGMRNMANEQVGRIETNVRNADRGPLAELSTGTGGMYVASTDNLRKPLRRMFQDLTTYYEASYVPHIEQYDGAFRAVAVKPLRRGLRIQARSGYFALSPQMGAGARPFEAPLLKVLSEPELPGDLRMHSAVLRKSEAPDGSDLSLQVEVALSDLEMHEDPNTKLVSARVTILAQVRDKTGAIVARFSEDVPRSWALEAQQRARLDTVTLERDFAVKPGHYVLETAAMDSYSGRCGAGRKSFEISEAPSDGEASHVSPESKLADGSDRVHYHAALLKAFPGREPRADELEATIGSARQRALDYTEALPNFTCVELTDRSMDASGSGKWRHRDTIAELLRYHDKHEDRVMLEVNGMRSDATREDLKGALSHGEFGGLLDAVFNPEAKAEFHWKETDALGSRTVQVFRYRVSRENSNFAITGDNGRQVKAAFHGLVYVDQATWGVRRITVEAEDLPVDFSIHAACFTVDYDYIAISDHDYLLPVSGTLQVSRGKRSVLLNQMEFRDYKRYGAESHVEF